jgi:apolipoprotein D and lipocalin family protein
MITICRGRFVAAAMMLTLLLAIPRPASAQTPTAVPKLDLNRAMLPWYEIAGYPVKAQKHCLSDIMVLYALGDKPNAFQVVTSCKIKGDNSDSWNATGKMDPAGDGMLKLRRLLILHTKYWVLALGSDYEWALVGSPNHKSLWVLSKSAELSPDVLAQIEARAAAQGFDPAKLVNVSQNPALTVSQDPAPKVSPSQPPKM